MAVEGEFEEEEEGRAWERGGGEEEKELEQVVDVDVHEARSNSAPRSTSDVTSEHDHGMQ